MSLCWSNITTKGSREKRSIFLLCVCTQQYTVQAIGADFFFLSVKMSLRCLFRNNSSCLGFRDFSRLNCLVNLAKAIQSNTRSCMSERERGGRKREEERVGLNQSRDACERLDEVMVICKLRFRALEDPPSI